MGKFTSNTLVCVWTPILVILQFSAWKSHRSWLTLQNSGFFWKPYTLEWRLFFRSFPKYLRLKFRPSYRPKIIPKMYCTRIGQGHVGAQILLGYTLALPSQSLIIFTFHSSPTVKTWRWVTQLISIDREMESKQNLLTNLPIFNGPAGRRKYVKDYIDYIADFIVSYYRYRAGTMT